MIYSPADKIKTSLFPAFLIAFERLSTPGSILIVFPGAFDFPLADWFSSALYH
jgi:hypothetical protein